MNRMTVKMTSDFKTNRLRILSFIPMLLFIIGVVLSATATYAQESDVAALLKKAEPCFQTKKFISPYSANAFELYQDVLRLDPDNAQARKRMQDMASTYKKWGDAARQNDDKIGARIHYYKYRIIAQYIYGTSWGHSIGNEIKEIQKLLDKIELSAPASQNDPSNTEAPSNSPDDLSKMNDSFASTSQSPSTGVQKGKDQKGQYPQKASGYATVKDNPLFLPILILAIVFLLSVIGVAAYMMIIRPHKKRKPFLKALAIIERGTESEYPKADDLLGKALTGGLRDSDIKEARFYQAFVKAFLKQYPEALAELKKISQPDKEAKYLEMWLYVKLEKFEDAIKLFEMNRSKLKGYLDSNLVAGIAYLHVAQKRWDSHEIKAAVSYFDILRELNVLIEHIPEYIDDHQIVLGISALFDEKIEEAYKLFDGAVDDAKKNKKPAIEGQLGQLLCEWIEKEIPDIDERLGEIVGEMESSIKIGKDNKPLTNEMQLLRNVLLWHAISLLFTWLHRFNVKTNLPEEARTEFYNRLEKISAVDPEMGDPYLLRGLVDYYFLNATHRKEAIDTLKAAMNKDVNLPDVINLVNQEEKQIEQERKSVDNFLKLLAKYLNDFSIPLELREKLKQHLDKFPRFKKIESEIKLGTDDDESLPSLQDIQNRSVILSRRVNTIVKPKLSNVETDNAKKIEKLLSDLKSSTENLTNGKNNLEKTEQELMLMTGEFLFQEEDLSETTTT